MRFQADDPIAEFYLADFDLSWNKSLHTLEAPVDSVDYTLRNGSLDVAARFLKYMLSTIQSPGFSQVVFVYQAHAFCTLKTLQPAWPHSCELSQDERAEAKSLQQKRFDLLREVHKARDFSLVLHADVQGTFGNYVVRMLKEDVAAEKARGGFDDFLSEPSVTSDLRPL